MTREDAPAAGPGADCGCGVTQARALGRRRLGADLRQLRQEWSLRLDDAAARLGIAPSTLSRIETGQAPVKAAYLMVMLDLYRVTDPAERERLIEMARSGQRKSWWAGHSHLLPAGAGQYLDLEAAATHLRSYSVHVLPALAQTAGYAAAAIGAARPSLTAGEVGDLDAPQLRRREQARSAGCRLHLPRPRHRGIQLPDRGVGSNRWRVICLPGYPRREREPDPVRVRSARPRPGWQASCGADGRADPRLGRQAPRLPGSVPRRPGRHHARSAASRADRGPAALPHHDLLARSRTTT